jgi:membrane carboxypeptidase/penicillin-binding protein
MEPILMKIFAAALALSQVFTRPGDVKTHFDPVGGRGEVVTLLQAGCAHLRQAFGIEAIDLDDLIATALADPNAKGNTEILHGLKLDELLTSYRQFCKNEKVAQSPIDLGAVIAFYNRAAAALPDPAVLKGKPLPGLTKVLDDGDAPFAEIGRPEQKRIWVALSDIPDHVQKAFVAAEDKRFFTHHGVDEQGMIRAFLGDLGRPGRPQGGSTITQQVAKNLLVGADVTFERKIREIILASRLERVLTKPEILALYLNSVYLGRGAWGVEMAARRYFGKHASELTLPEGAVLAALTRGPTFYGPDRHPDRTRERLNYVLGRMQQDGAINTEQEQQASARLPHFIDYQVAERDTGYYFVDQVAREAKTAAGIHLGGGYTVHSTIVPALQHAAEAVLQESLAQYELERGRQQFHQPEANLSAAIARIEQERGSDAGAQESAPSPLAIAPWLQALKSVRLPLYDVHWPAAVVLPSLQGGVLDVGLADGRVLPLKTPSSAARQALKPYDVVYVALSGKRRSRTVASLRVRPQVQGATIVIDNRTGRILAMAGGFSYPLSQLNRATQALRQPGSALKPITYLAALKAGLRPNSLVRDEPITLPPPEGATRKADYWTPRNDSGDTRGEITLRGALENSRNLATAHLLDGGIAKNPKDSLARVCQLAIAARLYAQCEPYYPFVLGTQPLRMVDLAAFYAAIADEGIRPAPHTIESIEQNGKVVYRFQKPSAGPIGDVDPANFDRLRIMLEGVVARGTARSIRDLAGYVAGKTGTTTDVNDAWFVGFSNEVTIAVWVGYDNGARQHATLGDGETGNSLAAPIFEKVMDAVWGDLGPRTFMRPPSAAARRQLVDLPIDAHSEPRKGRRAAVEHPHFDAQGTLGDDQSAAHSAHKPNKATQETSRHSGQRAHSATADTLSTNERTARPPARQSIDRSDPLNGQQQGLQGFWSGNGLYDQGWGNSSDRGNRSDWDERLNAH